MCLVQYREKMSRLRLATLLVVAGCAAGTVLHVSAASSVAPPGPSQLRLLQFNVRNAATDGRAAVIKASGADVVTLGDVNVKDIFNQIAAAVGFHSYYVPGNDGYSVGILSSFPIRRCFSYTEAPIQHAAYGCRIPIRGTSWWMGAAPRLCLPQPPGARHFRACDQLGRGLHLAVRPRDACGDVDQPTTEAIASNGGSAGELRSRKGAAGDPKCDGCGIVVGATPVNRSRHCRKASAVLERYPSGQRTVW